MTDVLDDQPVFRFNQREGVLVGFRTPQHMQGINVAGYHEHFITDDRQGGGHLLDYQLDHGVLTFGEIHKLMIDLPAIAPSCRRICILTILMPPFAQSKTKEILVDNQHQPRQWAHGADLIVSQLEAQGVQQVFRHSRGQNR
ncbi:alpha-acetolactate decarboxylase [Klebsiella michiganensis]|nr:alpha-acetolactate decarboxylase [Klebsiella michiganensis]